MGLEEAALAAVTEACSGAEVWAVVMGECAAEGRRAMALWVAAEVTVALVGVVGEQKGVARTAVMEMAVGTEASEG